MHAGPSILGRTRNAMGSAGAGETSKRRRLAAKPTPIRGTVAQDASTASAER
jgi:hypothetical protein